MCLWACTIAHKQQESIFIAKVKSRCVRWFAVAISASRFPWRRPENEGCAFFPLSPLPSPTFSPLLKPLLGYYSYWGAMNGVHSASVILDYRTSGVPQNVDVVPEGSIPSLQRPKSVKTTWPCKKLTHVESEPVSKLSYLGKRSEPRENAREPCENAPAPRGFAARSRILARLASLAQIGELARRLVENGSCCLQRSYKLVFLQLLVNQPTNMISTIKIVDTRKTVIWMQERIKGTEKASPIHTLFHS